MAGMITQPERNERESWESKMDDRLYRNIVEELVNVEACQQRELVNHFPTLVTSQFLFFSST